MLERAVPEERAAAGGHGGAVLAGEGAVLAGEAVRLRLAGEPTGGAKVWDQPTLTLALALAQALTLTITLVLTLTLTLILTLTLTLTLTLPRRTWPWEEAARRPERHPA